MNSFLFGSMFVFKQFYFIYTNLVGDSAKDTERVTRAVVQEAEDSPKRGRSTSRRGKPASEPAPESVTPARSRSRQKATPSKKTPTAKRTPTRGSRSRSARGKKKIEEDVDVEEEKEEEEVIQPAKSTFKRGRTRKATPTKSPAPKKSPVKKLTPAKSASRSRSRGKKESVEEQQSPLPDAQIVLTKIDSPQKASSPSKSPSPKAAKKTPSPSPKKAARSTPKRTPPSAGRGSRSRRGAQVQEEAQPEVEEAEKEEVQASEDVEKEKEEVMDTAESVEQKEEKKETEEEKAGTEEKNTAEEEEKVEEEEAAEESEEKVKTAAEEEAEEPMEPEMEEKPVQENAIEAISDDEVVEDSKMTENAQQNLAEKNGEDVEVPSQKRKLKEVQYGVEEEEDFSAKKPKLIEESELQTTGNEKNSMEFETIEEVKENMVEPETSFEKDYVMVNTNEVPAADSNEILDSIPKSLTEEPVKEVVQLVEKVEAVPVVDNQVEESENVVIEEVEIQEEVVKEPIKMEEFQPLGNEEVIQEVSSTPFLQQEIVQEANMVQPNQTEEIQQIVQSVNIEVNEQLPVSNSDKQDWVLNRRFIKNPAFRDDVADPAKQFSVVSYNILAQCHLERGNYSFTEPQFLATDHRYQKVLQELRYLDGDIVCLQEVEPEFYNDKLMAAMKEMGYEGLMRKRTDDYFNEGEAVFYKSSRFTIVESNTYSMAELANKEVDDGVGTSQQEAIKGYLNRPDVMVLVKLQCNRTGQILTVGNIHVHWGRIKVEDVKCIQIACAIKEVVNKAGSDMNPHIICGDFNSEVTSPGYQLCTEGYLSDACIQQLQSLENLQFQDGSKSSLINTLWRAFQHTSSSMKSAYKAAQGREPHLTTFRKAVDYVFFSSNCLDNVGVLEVAPEEAITQTGGIPDQMFPSDHVSIKAAFSFR